jgi:hypothetical protein
MPKHYLLRTHVHSANAEVIKLPSEVAGEAMNQFNKKYKKHVKEVIYLNATIRHKKRCLYVHATNMRRIRATSSSNCVTGATMQRI